MGDGVNLSFSEAVYILQHKREILSVVVYNSSVTVKQNKHTNGKKPSYFLVRITTTFNWMFIFIQFRSSGCLEQCKIYNLAVTSIHCSLPANPF